MGGVDLDLGDGDHGQNLGRGRLTHSLCAVPGFADPGAIALFLENRPSPF